MGGAEEGSERVKSIPPWPCPLHWAAALGKHRVSQKADPLHLYQAASMPNPEGLHSLFCMHAIVVAESCDNAVFLYAVLFARLQLCTACGNRSVSELPQHQDVLSRSWQGSRMQVYCLGA